MEKTAYRLKPIDEGKVDVEIDPVPIGLVLSDRAKERFHGFAERVQTLMPSWLRGVCLYFRNSLL